jgi:hypothetical protein
VQEVALQAAADAAEPGDEDRGTRAPPPAPQPAPERNHAGATANPAAGEGIARLESDAAKFLERARTFGVARRLKGLSKLPEFLSVRRDMWVHAYALWLVVMVCL